ncbi:MULTISPECIES: UbiD family decarboxylase [Achromobacter]|uniref:UbiD family decarboxylase n=1 Tax=Achromobacter spanius TaxID=217203 RepID=A0ABY8GMJ3_9BURK|nr:MULTISPECIES: UbiD family decarboxylase [Achromobacter]WAI84920.1 UbiD family decarboxylase [Achromobacter spanius]WEX95004.1 UbiD family decarboxylase [Achromobacter sp. SS2-2022]WFP05828.1 UbiD family decarboxylase [Achromobacter spanius]
MPHTTSLTPGLRTSARRLHTSLRDALSDYRARGFAVREADVGLRPNLEIAGHYRTQFATVPGSSKSGDEPVVLYQTKNGDFPVLLGLFGSRERNEWLLGARAREGAHTLMRAALSRPLRPSWVANPPCREQQAPDRLAALPTLTSTSQDAGSFITSGLVCAGEPNSGFVSLSIHRMRVLDDGHLTIWILPGRDLDHLYRQAAKAGRALPLSINIGVPPVVYLTSSLSSPLVAPGGGELETAGVLLGRPVEIARCATNSAFCLAQSEIVIEASLLQQTVAESSGSGSDFSMPEFLGYMGKAQDNLPVVRVSGVFHRRNAIYQTFIGPGKEQSELLALASEAAILMHLNRVAEPHLRVKDAHYLAAGGGQLLLVLQVEKRLDHPESMPRLRDAVMQSHALSKGIIVVDEDVNIHSPEDVFWALATRFQPSVDLYVSSGAAGFSLDPSQAAGYLHATNPVTDKYLMDLTVPCHLRPQFVRT